MSLLSTLAKAAVGMAVAKQVSKVLGGSKGRRQAPQGGGLTDILGQLTKGRQQAGAGGGLGDILGQVMGGGAAKQQSGGLGDLLGQLTKKQGGSAGGLQDILGKLAGGQQAPAINPSAQAGGNPLESILGGILGKTVGGGAAQQSGSLGGLLDALTNKTGGAQSAGVGGLGGLLNQAMNRFGEPETQPTAEQDQAAGILLSAMIQAAKADGAIDEAEKEALFKSMGDDISQDEANFLNEQMVRPVDPEGLAASIPSGLRQQAYTMSLLVIDLDSQKEAEYLHRFATALNLEHNAVNAIHQQMGEPALYA